eukprot:TRINITY_DN20582_c0_g1_i1.p1 TRINITY_DN20582_c0_g1~~TRINITY_DN20582_c0_g1_i1.p1  ORF type:complete len:599 (+),score=61.34 TRINITY_DN20582_c0_g1_i1:97-1893(+)
MLLLLGCSAVGLASSHIQFQSEVPNAMHVPNSVAIGHWNKFGGGENNLFGAAFKRNGLKWTKALCEADSDGDGVSNGHELGDPCCVWTRGAMPRRTYAISHPGDPHCSTIEPHPSSCDEVVGHTDIVAAEDEHFYSFYYKSRADLLQPNSVVSSIYSTLANMSAKGKNFCGAESEAEHAVDRSRKATGLGPMCGVCSACCGGRYAANQQTCDDCVSRSCTRQPYAVRGNYEKSCTECISSEGSDGWQLRCSCRDSFGLPVHTTCNPLYCSSDPASTSQVELMNKYGHLACMTGLNFCQASYNYSQANYRIMPPSAYEPSLLSFEGALARVFGSYKALDEIDGDANKAVGNVLASLVVFGTFVALLVVDGRWMRESCTSATNALLLFIAACFVDVYSGVLHICLDNPNFVQLPIIGPQCQSFQTHHDAPTRLLVVPWFGYLSEHHAIMAICMCTVAGNRKSRSLRVFLAYAVVFSELMMASHRWSHVHPLEQPWAVKSLSQVGLLMSVRMHSYHHVTYDMNFCIFTGWFNPLLNCAVWLIHHQSQFWLYALIFINFIPLLASLVGLPLVQLVVSLISTMRRFNKSLVQIQPRLDSKGIV